VLAQGGHQALVAVNIAQGLHLLHCVAPDVVITDVFLPELERLQAFRLVYRRHRPKVMLIGLSRNSEQTGMISDGVRGVYRLRADISEAELLASIDAALNNGEHG
jgi:DNA-binding NarL/FixJ family response regulator